MNSFVCVIDIFREMFLATRSSISDFFESSLYFGLYLGQFVATNTATDDSIISVKTLRPHMIH